ncbi:hypothetical protein CMK11_18810 [Candidatus Poribacteria bacterium]|nr:hypothetical protein [Candidatus Poribacteria bacterium]
MRSEPRRTWGVGDTMGFAPVVRVVREIMAATLLIACVRAASATVDVILPDVQAEPGARVTLPIEVSDVTEDQLSAAEFTLVYDPSVATFISVTTVGGLAQGWLLSHKSADGQVGIAMASARPTSGSGALVYTVFEVLPCATGATDLTLARVRLNRDIPVTIRNGSIAVDSGPLTDFRMRLPAAWDLVSLPGAGDPAALRGITATAYAWDAPTQGYRLLQSVDARSLPAVTGGLFVRHLRANDSALVSMDLDTNNACVRAAATTLYPGWNIVGAPAGDDAPVSVAALRDDSSTGWSSMSANSVLAYDPDTRSYAPASALEAGHGHWVYNALGREHLVALPQARDLVGGRHAPTRRTGLAASSAGFGMRLTDAAGMSAEVSLVVSDDAQVGFDALDVPAPPPAPGADGPLMLVLSESRPSRLMRSARPMRDNAASWLIATDVPAQGVLEWDAAPLPDGYIATLDLNGSRHDLRRPGAVTLPPGARRFTVNVTFVAPNSTRVFANYPNPFNPETWIPFQLTAPADVRMHVYDAHGSRIRSLDLGRLTTGYYLRQGRAARWDGRNADGSHVSSGVYFVELDAGGHREVRRIVVGK